MAFRAAIVLLLMSSKISSSQYFLYLWEQKKIVWGLDPVNRQGVPTQLFVQQLKTPSQTVPCEQVHCRDARSMSCWQNFGSFPSKFFTQPFQYYQVVNLVDCLSSWYKFIMNNPANIKFANFIYRPRFLRSINIFPQTSRRLRDNMVIYFRARQATDHWRMRIACQMPKATDTRSQHVIFIPLPLQQWFHESTSMLHYSPLRVLFNPYPANVENMVSS